MRTILHIIGIFILFQSASAQIKGISYQLSFNDKTNLFDCYLVIKKGQAVSPRERIQFNAQITFIVPAGSNLKIVQSYMPLQNNRTYNGDKPMQWSIANSSLKPDADRTHDYISIIPLLTPTAYYNNLQEGDKVKLFSADISNVTNCGADVRLFQNGDDLNSAARGMGGGDYSNGFTMGGVEQKYAGNEIQILPDLDVIAQLGFTSNKKTNKINVSLKPDALFGPFTYNWTGPEAFSSKTGNINFDNSASLVSGLYHLEVTDSRGCKQNKSIEIKNDTHQPNTLAVVDVTEPLNVVDSRSNIAKENVQIFPNPAINYFTIQIEGENGTNVAVDIRDMSGRVVRKNVINSVIQNNKIETNIQLDDFTPGIYNVTVSMKENVTTHKLIVVK